MKIESATCLNPSSATFSRSFPQNLQLPHSFRPLGGGKHHWKFDFGGFDLMGTFLIKKMELLVVEVTSINLNTMKDELLMQTLNLFFPFSEQQSIASPRPGILTID